MAYEGDDGLASYDEVYGTFEGMDLKEDLLAGIYAYGFEKPSEVQQKGIVPFCKGLDVFVQAESEPGRTSTFCTGILQRCDCDLDECQCIILAPTPDLVEEILRVLRELGAHLDLRVYACGEGFSVVNDLRYFEDNDILTKVFHVVVGNPWSVWSMFERKILYPDHVKIVVLDDEDNSIALDKNMIFKLLKLLPSNVQVGVFAETMSGAAVEAIHSFRSKDKHLPVKIAVEKKQVSFVPLEGMTHLAPKVKKLDEKPKLLLELLDGLPTTTQCIIYVNSVYWAARLIVILQLNSKLRVRAMHSNMDQTYRDMLIREFQAGAINVLITTDHLARGFDFKVPLIVNYDMTFFTSEYRERITRFGIRGGIVINVGHEDFLLHLMTVESECGVKFEELPGNYSDVLQKLLTN